MKKLIPILAFLALTTYACSNDDDTTQQPCTSEVVPALNVVVTNANTAAAISTGITVTATDGEYIDELDYLETEQLFYGVNERTGTYTITVTGQGYQPYASQPVTVTADDCHVITQTVNVSLLPAE